MSAFHLARQRCSDLLSAFELMMPPAMDMARAVLPGAPALATPFAAYALIELAAPGPIAPAPVTPATPTPSAPAAPSAPATPAAPAASSTTPAAPSPKPRPS